MNGFILDEVKTIQQLNDVLSSVDEAPVIADSVTNRETTEQTVVLDWNEAVTGKKPRRIVIDETEYEAATWKQIYIQFCQFLCHTDLEQFKQTKLSGKKRAYFSVTDRDLRVPYFLEDAQLYMEVNLSAQSVLRNIRALMQEFQMGEQSVKIVVEKEE